MAYETIIFEVEDGVATLTLNRPETLNAWSIKMMEETDAAIQEIDNDMNVRALIITGAGKGFSSGADVNEVMGPVIRHDPFLQTVAARTLLDQMPNVASIAAKLPTLSQPVIAAINGTTGGGGMAIAAACDIRIASENAKLASAYINKSLIPDAGMTWLLPRLLGTGFACEFMFTDDSIDANEALRIGLVNRVVPHEKLMETAKELARKIAVKPPIALKLSKKAIYQGIIEPRIEAHMKLEVALNLLVGQTEDFQEGIASFLEKRKPIFKGR